ncbi:MAG: arginine--tRNA ligase [Flavobacteriales bacterium]|nr:MAG: arginine--tRNA ligase [Flavobacteriales bacterium]
MSLDKLKNKIKESIFTLYSNNELNIQFQKTKKNFDGDLTIVVFPLLVVSKKSAEKTSSEIASCLKKNINEIIDFNIVGGFLNLIFSNNFWLTQFKNIYDDKNYGIKIADKNSDKYVVEYSSPNTNKPLHLGHIRNILLGHSISEILKANGNNVIKVQIINDRGIHICKSMVAWKKFGSGENPQSSNIKGDHLVGKYYVKFNTVYSEQVNDLVKKGYSLDQAEKQAPIFLEAQNMLLKWESGDKEIIDLWKKMNNWVYDGFDETYSRLNVSFDKNYYESNTFLLGKNIIEDGLKKNIFYQKDDKSVWASLSKYNLDDKILLRADGTSVYITQDIGTAVQRHEDFSFTNMIYTVGNEQNHHFKVLFSILDLLSYNWSSNCKHLSYGMVDLPSGKMKSREGTVVDADDLMSNLVNNAKKISQDLGKTKGMGQNDIDSLYEKVGLGALKYFILKVDPHKNMLFNTEESIDFNGNTGPFVQYTYARIQSLLRNCDYQLLLDFHDDYKLNSSEKNLIKLMCQFPNILSDSAKQLNPSLLANYSYELSKEFNQFYQSCPILNNKNKNIIILRLVISKKISEIIKSSMTLLGILMPDKM